MRQNGSSVYMDHDRTSTHNFESCQLYVFLAIARLAFILFLMDSFSLIYVIMSTIMYWEDDHLFN